MWTFDIDGSAYNSELRRRFCIKKIYKPRRYKNPERDKFNQQLQLKVDPFFTVVEEWYTSEGAENTGDFDHYTFSTSQEAYVFVAHLCLRLNNPLQNILLDATKGIAIAIIDEISKRRVQHKNQTYQKSQNIGTVVYVFDMGNGTVKIGISCNVTARKNAISNSSGLTIRKWCYTKPMLKWKALEIEHKCHQIFNSQRQKGEFFKITYEEAHEKLQSFVKEKLVEHEQ